MMINEIQSELFDTSIQRPEWTRPPSEMESRRKAMDAAFEHADSRFVDEYTALVMRFIDEGRSFTGFDVQDAYRQRKDLPQPRDFRSTGRIFVRLLREGIIEVRGYRKRPNSNVTAVYIGVK